MSSMSSSMSFLSSHHSDDFSLLGVDEETVEMPPAFPRLAVGTVVTLV